MHVAENIIISHIVHHSVYEITKDIGMVIEALIVINIVIGVETEILSEFRVDLKYAKNECGADLLIANSRLRPWLKDQQSFFRGYWALKRVQVGLIRTGAYHYAHRNSASVD